LQRLRDSGRSTPLSTRSRRCRFFCPTDRLPCKRPLAGVVVGIKIRENQPFADFYRRCEEDSSRMAGLKNAAALDVTFREEPFAVKGSIGRIKDLIARDAAWPLDVTATTDGAKVTAKGRLDPRPAIPALDLALDAEVKQTAGVAKLLGTVSPGWALVILGFGAASGVAAMTVYLATRTAVVGSIVATVPVS
jgi:hypothetical protein